jgi:hypothetical protein
MACKCDICGKEYKVDILVSNSLWEKYIKPKNKSIGGGLVCGECIMKIIENIGEYNAFKLIKI